MNFKDRILRHSQGLEGVQSSLVTSGLSDFFFSYDALLLVLSGCDLHHLGRLAAECEVFGMRVSTSWFMSEEGELSPMDLEGSAATSAKA